MAFTIGTGTFTNGSRDVTGVLFTSGGPSFISSGTSMVVGNNPIISQQEATEATNTTVKLRDSWVFPTGSYQFVATYTTENLRDAVQSAKQFSSKLEEANGLIASLGNIYESTTEGLLNTASGDYFSVAGSGDIFLTLYKNVEGVAEEQESVASKERTDLSIIKADEATVSAANALQSENNAAATYASFTTDYNQFNVDFATFSTNYSTFDTNYTTFDTNYTIFDTKYTQFDMDYDQFVIDFTSFTSDYSQFVTDLSGFSTDFAQFNLDYASFTSDFSTFSTNYALFDTNYTQFDSDYTDFTTVELPLALSYKNDAESARNISLANANFAGQWSDQSGAKSPPFSIRHEPSGELDQIWMLNNSVADIALSEPSASNSDWFGIGVIGTTAPDSDALGGETAAQWQAKIDSLQSQVDTNRIFSLAGL